MNTSSSSEAIDSELVAEVVRVMREEHLIASAATSLVICRQKRSFGNAVLVAAAAQEVYSKENGTRRRPPRPWSHANASHEALAAKERSTW